MKLTMILTCLLLSTAAFANPLPIDRHRALQVPVSHMTCSQAHAYAMKHGYYLKDTADGLMPMYPIEPTAGGLHCSGSRNTTVPQTERTLDQRACVLSWYCI
jgi:hypothetical protein